MAKWADYLISAVQYNQGETHIDYVKEHIDKGDSVAAATVSARSTVVSRIKTGTTYVTVTMNSAQAIPEPALQPPVSVEGTVKVSVVPFEDETFCIAPGPKWIVLPVEVKPVPVMVTV